MNTDNNELGHVEQQLDESEAPQTLQETNDEQESVTEQQAPPEQASIVRTKLPIEKREADRIEKQRKAIYFANPQEVYFNHHVKRHWSFVVLHLCLMCLSIPIILFIVYAVATKLGSDTGYVHGVGQVSDVTIIDILYMFFSLLIIVLGIKDLIKNTVLMNSKRYRLIMISNILGFIIVKHIKLCIYLMALILFVMYGNKSDIYTAQSMLFDGAVSDSIGFLIGLYSLHILYRAFNACHGEITQ